MSPKSLGAALALTLALAACSDPKPQAKAPPTPAPEQTAPQPSTPAPARKTTPIVDGIGVAGIALGQTPAQVEAQLGRPERTNKDGPRVVFMSYDRDGIFGVYFDDDGRVRMIIAAMQDGTWCTAYDVCLYREGDLAKLKVHYGDKLLRFTDRDGSVTYRLLEKKGETQVMTEFTPVEPRNGVVQVMIATWQGPIDRSSFD